MSKVKTCIIVPVLQVEKLRQGSDTSCSKSLGRSGSGQLH